MTIKIAIDNSIADCYEYLRAKNRHVDLVDLTSAQDIHNLLHDNNINAFFTKNYDPFMDFYRNYFLYGLQLDRPADIMADVMECLIEKSYKAKFVHKVKPFYLINDAILYDMGCNM